MHADDLDGQTFHLTAPKAIGLRGIYRGIAETAGLPPVRGSLPRSPAAPVLQVTGRAKVLRNMAATQLGMPPEVLDVVDLAPTSQAEETREALQGNAESRFPSSPATRQGCGGTGQSTSILTARDAQTQAPPGGPARHHHRRVQRDRPGFGDRCRQARRDGVRAGP